jgi:hypothetical protein
MYSGFVSTLFFLFLWLLPAFWVSWTGVSGLPAPPDGVFFAGQGGLAKWQLIAVLSALPSVEERQLPTFG